MKKVQMKKKIVQIWTKNGLNEQKIFILYYFRVRLGYDTFWAERCG